MQFKPFLPYVLFFILLAGAAFALTFNSLDPDFGWHVRTGQLILERGIPHQDWYTFTMPSFAWIDHEWLFNVFMYKAYEFLGIHGMQFLFVVMYTPAFFILRKRGQSFWIFSVVTFLAYMAAIDFLGIRPQVLTPLFVAMLLWLVDRFLEKNSTVIYLVPILILAWTNLHASFFAGLFVLGIVIACELLKKSPSKKIFTLIAIACISFLATMINPYGLRIYEELFRTIGDSYLKFHITEWNPLFISEFKPLVVLYISVVVALAIKQYKKLSFNYLVLSAIFLLLTLSSIRYFFIFAVVSLPLVLQAATQLSRQIHWHKGATLLVSGVLVVCFGMYFYQTSTQILQAGTKDFYPSKAVSFLKTLPLSENMFNEYAWGGYLIWQIPERKVFIDGRMPSWRQNGQFVFGDYTDIYEAKPGFEAVLQKYQVSFAVIPHNHLATTLKDIGWNTLYEDETTLVLKKP